MKKDEVKEYHSKLISLTYRIESKKCTNQITGMIQHICNDFFIFNLNNLPNGKELKINYESVISINKPEMA